MEQAQRLDSKAMHGEGSAGNQGHVPKIGDIGIVDVLVAGVDVLEDPVQFLPDLRFGMNRDRALHQGVVSTDLVETEHMVDMGMGHQDRVTAHDPLAKRLFPVVGRNVDEDHPGLTRSDR